MPQRDTFGPVPAISSLPAQPLLMSWHGRRISTHQFVCEYAACIDSFRTEVAQTVSRFHPLPHWQARGEIETLAAMRAVVVTIFDSTAIREHSLQIVLSQVLSQVLSELSVVWGYRRSAMDSALLASSKKYCSVLDLANPRSSGARMVELYLEAVGLRLPGRSVVPERYLSTRFACRILADRYRLSVAFDLDDTLVSLSEAGSVDRSTNTENKTLQFA
jgi:hypothetical protein